MATIQGHPFYDQEKAAFEQDPANSPVGSGQGQRGTGRPCSGHYPRCARPGTPSALFTPLRFDGTGWSHVGDPADDWMKKLAEASIEGNGGLFIMAPPGGHRESVEMFFRLFEPFLGKGGHIVLFFVTGRMHPGTLDSVLSWQQRVQTETSGSLDFAFFDQERGLSTGDAGFFQIVTKTGYFFSGFYTPGGWCTKFWSKDEPPKNMTFGNLSLGSRPLKAASEETRKLVDEELEEITGHVKHWARTALFPTPSVLKYVRAKEASASC